MPVADDSAELRELQARAYGRGGGLTEADAARLRELEGSRAAAEPVVERDETAGPLSTDPVREPAERGETAAGPLPDSGTRDPVVERAERDEARPDASRPAGGIRRTGILIGAAAMLVVVGVGVGWLLFGRGALPAAVPASQHDALAMLEEGSYDPGSVRYVGEKHEVAIWQATRDGGTLECIVLTHADIDGSACEPVAPNPDEGVETMMSPGLSATIDFEDDGESVMVWATIMPDISGDDAVLAQRQVMADADWRQGFSPEELETIDVLQDAGFDPRSLYVVGYDGDQSVWQGLREDVTCLAVVVEGGAHLGCADTAAIDEVVRLRMGSTDYELRQTPQRGPVFSIIRHVSADDEHLEPGESLLLGEELGDPIELTPDPPQG